MNKKLLFVSVVIFFIFTFFVAMTLFKNEKSSTEMPTVVNNLAALVREGAPIKGPANAKVTIVEFFDPACGTCSNFYPLVNDLIAQFPGKVKVEMRYAPLHQGSDEVVKMLEAAHLQGKFWSALELLFADQGKWVVNHVSQAPRAENILTSIGLNREQFANDRNSFLVAKTVKQDITDGQTLNVRATPEFFVNGRPMPSFGYEQLQQLVAEAVAEAYKN